MERVSTNEVKRLYASYVAGRLDIDMLWGVASQLYDLAEATGCQDVVGDDHDWLKDAEKFMAAYQRACEGRVHYLYAGRMSVEDYLMHEIDVLVHGCHTDSSPADYYFEGGLDVVEELAG